MRYKLSIFSLDKIGMGVYEFGSAEELISFIEQNGYFDTSKYKIGFKIRVGDLIYYTTVAFDYCDGYEEPCYENYYGIVKSIVRYNGKDIFDIKTLYGQYGDSTQVGDEEELYDIKQVCTSQYFDNLINKERENADTKIRFLERDINIIKADCEKHIEQFVRLKQLTQRELNV